MEYEDSEGILITIWTKKEMIFTQVLEACRKGEFIASNREGPGLMRVAGMSK